MAISLKNKIVFITGASSGIGAACARQFATLGTKLLLCARRIDLLQSLQQELQSHHHDVAVHVFPLDVRNREEVQSALQSLPPEWKTVDILINNAGLAAGLDTLQEGIVQDWEDMIDTNVKGLLYLTKAILPVMLDRNAGHIINLGSIAGHHVYPKGAVYCATKHAVNVLTQGLRMDLYGKKIRVTTIDPGAVETNFSRVRFKGDQALADAVYQGMEPLSAEDIADAIAYAATRPLHVNVSEMILMPVDQAAINMIARTV